MLCRAPELNFPTPLKLALKVVLKSSHDVFKRASILTKIDNLNLKTLDARPLDCIFQHFLQPEAYPEGGIKRYP